MRRILTPRSLLILGIIFTFSLISSAQDKGRKKDSKKKQADVRVMTIPISIFTEKEIAKKQTEEFVQAGSLIVREDGDVQDILSIRSVSTQPLALAVLIQDDLNRGVNNQLRDIAAFILGLPRGSRVMVAYLRGGSIQIRQRFTNDLEKAADSLRIIIGNPSVAPRNPYDGVIDALKRFEGVPTGRRAILLLSDGLDVSNGFRNSTPTSSNDLGSAILKAQRRGVAVYSFYASATYTAGGNQTLINNAQGSLNRISEETGGRAFFQGTFTPVSYRPFFRDLSLLLNRQFAISYLSTHMKKGYHKVDVQSTNPEVKIEHPKGYYYRRRK